MERKDYELKMISRKFYFSAKKQDPIATSIFLYHLIKQHPKCSFVKDIQRGFNATRKLLSQQFHWTDAQILDCLKSLNELTKYLPKKS